MNKYSPSARRCLCWCGGIMLASLLVTPTTALAGDHPACPGDGGCFVANDTPGCNDAGCCNAVCDVDAFCCRVQWDSLCADEAQGLCQAVCSKEPCAGAGVCSSDLNADGTVDDADLGLLLGEWGLSPGGCPDFDCDGTVGGADLGWFLGDWGTTGGTYSTCTAGAIPEDEPCGTDTNGGCNVPACGGASDCCSAHVSTGCDNAECESTVCANDAFCCDVVWDGLCADVACALCPRTCLPNEPPVTPIACGAAVCGTAWALDGQRDTDWYELDLSDRDGTCRITATLVASFPATALLIFDDQCEPMTLGAGDDDCPIVATACVNPGVYRIVVAQGVFNGFPCDGGQVEYLLTVDCDCNEVCEPAACGVPGTGNCCAPHATPFCDDADCCEAVCSLVPFCCEVEWDVNCAFHGANLCAVCQSPGACCLTDGSCVQTGGPMECNGLTGDFQGAGTTCEASRCPAICDPGAGDCCADGGHFNPGCNDPACCNAVCSTDPFCCNIQWDASCAEAAEDLCAICQLPGACCLKDGSCQDAGSAAECEALGGQFIGANTDCATTECSPICGPGAGSCFEPHGTPGCDDAECCFTICAIDPFCCDATWDSICVDEASSFCINCGGPTSGASCEGTDEGEPCGTDTNGGCNSNPEVFGAIACGETICGSAWADVDTRDTDWFAFTLAGEGNQIVVVTLEADFSNATLLILDNNCPAAAFAIGEGNCTTVATACLAPGDYRIIVSQGVFEGFPCDGGAVNYAVTLDCTEEPCMAEGCGSQGAGDCCIANKTPFCNDATCCETICRTDPFCCETEWDQPCADQAGVLCDACT